MNIVLWILQVLVGLYTVMGALWRFFNYQAEAKNIASLAALPAWAWALINLFEIACALILILPGLLRRKGLVGQAAAALAVELCLVTALHVRYFGFHPAATNPATWSFGLGAVAAFVAYGRLKLKPL